MPMMRAPGLFALTAVARPAMSPPPPMATRIRLDVRKLLENFEAHRALSRHHGRIGEGMEIDTTGKFSECDRLAIRFVPERADDAGLGAPSANLLDLLGAHRLRREDSRWNARETGRTRHREPVVAAGGRNDSFGQHLARRG